MNTLKLLALCLLISYLISQAQAESTTENAYQIKSPSQFAYQSTQKGPDKGIRGDFIIETTPLSGNSLIAIRHNGVNFHRDKNGTWQDRKPGTYENSLQVKGTPYSLITLMGKARIKPQKWKTMFGAVETPRSKAAREFFAHFSQPAVRICLKLMQDNQLKPGEYAPPPNSGLTEPIVVKEDTILGVPLWNFQFAFTPQNGKTVQYQICLSQDKAIPFLIESVQAKAEMSSSIKLTSSSVYRSTFRNL